MIVGALPDRVGMTLREPILIPVKEMLRSNVLSRTHGVAFGSTVALFALLMAAIAATDSLSQTELGRGSHGFGAYVLTSPLFGMFAAGSFLLALFVIHHRKHLRLPAVLVGLLPVTFTVFGSAWVAFLMITWSVG